MKTFRAWFAICGLFFAVNGNAQTILSGNISGTWLPSGNPYIISANATVQSGQTLTIEPGVIVWIASGVSITVNGGIQAVGTPSQHIAFQAPISSQYWNTISVNNGGSNVFNYCDFSSATNALAFVGTGSNQVKYCTFTNVMGTALALAFNTPPYNIQSGIQVLFTSFQNVSNGIAMEVVNGIYSPLTANIVNCSFSNCWGTAVSGIGNGGNNFPGWIAATIENCSFSSIGIGCSFYLSGVNYYGAYNGYGMGNVQLLDNLFNNITDTAISLTQNGIALNSPATVINNIIFNASNAIISQDPWDATVMDNIFMGCTNVVTDNGSLSRNIEFNDFYKNATNFIGYSSDYGTVIIDNRNSTPCDLLFNLYQNPLFVTTNNFKFTLQTNSPCIDAGTPNIAYMDTSFPPSQGTSFPDLGIYGGPLAANWLPVIQSSGASFGVLTNTFGFAISAPFSMSIVVQVQACTNLASGAWSALQSCTLTNGSSQFSDPAWTNYPGRFYRISYPYP